MRGRRQTQWPGAYGGGIGGRLDPLTGAHYAAWLYPAGSPGGSDVLRLYKFQSWTEYGYGNVSQAAMAQAAVPEVGTNWHSLKLAFQSNTVSAWYDGVLTVSNTDTELVTYPGGGITLEQWTDAVGNEMPYDDVLVTALAAAGQPGVLHLQLRAAGSFVISYQGDAGARTVLQTATNLAPPVAWATVVTNVADSSGQWNYTNTPSPETLKFYRTLNQ